MLGRGARYRAVAARHQHAGDGRADTARRIARAAIRRARDHRLGLWRHDQSAHRDEPRRLRFRHQAGRPQRPRNHHPEDPRRHRQVARARPTGAPRPSAPAPICRAIFRRTSSRCWPIATSRLGAVRRQTVAVLFVDIVGFTRMAERLAPEAVVTMLRQFHERMTAQIFACGGTVEKYIGDAIFAVFGLPDADPRGCRQRAPLRRLDDRQRSPTGTSSAGRRASSRSPSASASITARR